MSAKMKAAFLHSPYDIRVEETEKPKADPDEIVIKTRGAGICPTDLRKYTGAVESKQPIVLGHEFSGDVYEVGKDVTGIDEGEPVIADPFLYCHNCYYCDRGRFKYCLNIGAVGGAGELGKRYSGSFAEYLKVPSKNVIKIANGVSYEEAALVEPLAACLNGILNCNITPGDTVAIIGSGPIGLMHLQLAKYVGAGDVIVSELLEHRRAKAEELGADLVINPEEEDPVEVIKDLTDGRGAENVIVASGRQEEASSTEQGLEMVSRGGAVNIFAGTWPLTRMQIDPNIIHYGEIRLVGSYQYTPGIFSRAAKIVFDRRLRMREIISDILPLGDIKKGLELAQGRNGLKVVIRI